MRTKAYGKHSVNDMAELFLIRMRYILFCFFFGVCVCVWLTGLLHDVISDRDSISITVR